MLIGPPQIEVRVAKRVDIARAARSLAGGNTVGSVLARVMHQQNREAKLPGPVPKER